MSNILHFFPHEKGDPRPTQQDALLRIDAAFSSGNTMVALQAPVGSGKTFVAQALARKEMSLGHRCYFLSPQRQHQDQYGADFPPPRTEILKGRANYPCDHKDAKKWMNAANGVCRQRERGILPECVSGCRREDTFILPEVAALRVSASRILCRYHRQVKLASDSPEAVFNFASFLNQQRLGRFGRREFMVIDECHNIESELMRFVELSLSERTLGSLKIRIDREISSKDELLRWMEEKQVLETVKAKLGPALSDDGGVAPGMTPEETDRLRSLLERLEGFRERLDMTEWVVETVIDIDPEDPSHEKSKRIRCRPLSARPFAKPLLFSKAERILFMSGTILDLRLWARNLGLWPGDIAYVEEPCTFPVENRTIHLDFAGNMGRKHFDATKPKFLAKIAEILDRHSGQKGIIHCQSSSSSGSSGQKPRMANVDVSRSERPSNRLIRA